MAEDKVESREISWHQLLPWTEIFRGFAVAFDLNKLLLAAAGIVVMYIGGWLLAVIFSAGYSSQPPQWKGNYSQFENPQDPSAPFKTFRRDRDQWNLMHETAAVGKNDEYVYEVGDLADSEPEYDLVKAAVGDNPDHFNLEALDKLIVPADKAGDAQKGLPASKVLIYKALLGKPKPRGRLATAPWSEDRGPNPYLLVTGQAGIPWQAGHFLEWLTRDQFPVLIEPLIKLVRPVVYFFSHRADGFLTKLYFLLVFVWTVLTWSLFGGAITRIAVVQIARPGEPIGLTEAFRFVLRRLSSYVAAPLFPLGLVFVLLVFASIFGLVLFIPLVSDIFVGGLLWFLMLLLGLVMALALVGLAVGWPLMPPTVSAEGTDSWEALSRSFSYVFQRPWHYLWYCVLTVAYGAIVIFFIGFMGSFTVYLSKWAVMQTPFLASSDREPSFLFVYTPTSFGWRTLLLQGAKDRFGEGRTNDLIVQNGQINRGAYDRYLASLSWWNLVGAAMVAFWVTLVFLLVLGFGYSFFFSSATIIYLLLRRNLDAADLDEVYLEDEEQEGFGGPLTNTAPEPPKSNQPLQMVEAPTLRPSAPASSPPPVGETTNLPPQAHSSDGGTPPPA